MDLTAERARALLNYDPETGVFTWRISRRGVRACNEAGHAKEHYRRPGLFYRFIQVDGRIYRAHRLAWLHAHGEWPDLEIDHINGDGLDNRLANLRLATRAQNLANQRVTKSNTSGFKGVCWDRQKKRWMAQIRLNGRNVHLGRFREPEAAAAAYAAAAVKHHGEFARI